MWNRRRRAAINQAEIRKRCKRYKELMEGFKAFQQNIFLDMNPYPHTKMNQYQAWMNGWCMGQLKQREKDDEKRLDP